jgi:septal ring factor EnvC (AmiA/AmiB activator)
MAIMLAKRYAALKAAGAPEEDAVAAAEELAEYENRLTLIDNRLAAMEGRLAAVEARVSGLENALGQFRADASARFTMLTWAVGINAAATIAILGILLRGHGS